MVNNLQDRFEGVKDLVRWEREMERREEEGKEKDTGEETNGKDFRVEYYFLEGDFGRKIFYRYIQRAVDEYKSASALNVLTFADNAVKGSNSFAFVLLDEILREEGMWVARPIDLENALKEGSLNLGETYQDSALVLRSDGQPNQYLAKYLVNQISQRENIQYPIMIPLTGLNLVNDSNSPYNLSFKLKNEANLVYAPQLEHTNNLSKFNYTDKNGLPIFDSVGSRTLYAKKGGLRRLHRGRNPNLNSGDAGIINSSEVGRVVVCRKSDFSNL